MFLRALSQSEALALRSQHADAVVVAGGTRLMSLAPPDRPRLLLDLSAAGLDGVVAQGGGWRLGAMTPVAVLQQLMAHDPAWGALLDAAAEIQPRFLKHQPTLGGNVCADGILLAPLAVLGAQAEVASVRGRRRVPVQALALEADELLIALELPVPDVIRSGHASLRRVPSGPVVAALALAVGRAGVRVAVQYVESTLALRGPWPDAADMPDRLAASLHGQSDAQAGSLYRQAMAGELARRLRLRLDQPASTGNG